MKPTQFAELLANIKATFVSFFSILMFVALGVGVFAGIYWMSSALENMADTEFDKGVFHHFQIQFPYGLTEEDVGELQGVEGVDAVEPAYQMFRTAQSGSRSYTVKVQSAPESIDTLQLVEGALPELDDEIVLNEASASTIGVSVGDTLTFEAGEQAASTASESPMSRNEFRVVGIVNSPEYLAVSNATFGFSGSGTGVVDAVAWVPSQAFSAKAFNNGWPVVNVRCDSLQGLGLLSSQYKDASKGIEEQITALGDKLGDARYQKLHADAAAKIADGEEKLKDAQEKITDGEQQLKDGKEQIADGELKIRDGKDKLAHGNAQVADGEKKLAAGKKEYQSETAVAQKKLDAAKKKLDAGQKEYDKASAQLAKAKAASDKLRETYAAAKKRVSEAKSALDKLEKAQARYGKLLEQGKITEKEFWKAVQPLYRAFKKVYDSARSAISALNSALDNAKKAYPDIKVIGSIPRLPELPSLPNSISTNVFERAQKQLNNATAKAKSALSKARSAQIKVAGQTVSLKTAGRILPLASKEITKAEKQLAKKKKELDAGKKKYSAAKAQFDKETAKARKDLNAAEEKLRAAKQKVSVAQTDLIAARAELKKGKEELETKTAELEDAKKQLIAKTEELMEAKRKFGLMKDYGWTVSARSYNGGAVEVSTFAGVTHRLSFTMAALFIIVGLLVSYSAVSRIVHEQITQIGTKKALGLRAKEITTSFLMYAALAVVAGGIVGIIVGVIVVEGIIGNAMAQRFTVDALATYFDAPLTLTVMAVEIVLVLGATWFACRKILKEHAVELLKGEKPPSGKTRFFEKWKLWDKLPLMTQTIVNNCINDKRRVFSTVVGVAGCTALVVTAITLNNDVMKSYDLQYENDFGFNTIAYADPDVKGAADAMYDTLVANGHPSAAIIHQTQAMQLPDGERDAVTLTVPENNDDFFALYHIAPTEGGDVDLSGEGVWMSQAYATHRNANVGDEVVVNSPDGSVHRLAIAGFYEHYLTYNEMVVGRDTYEQVFATDYVPNAVLSDTGDEPIENIESSLSAVKGFDSVIDDKTTQYKNFAAFANVSRTVVLVYLALSTLMAIVVLLNLNVMFIDEKKRELIVLMINGFSVKDAKRYVYNDTIVLTVVGIVIGLLLGIVMGSATVSSVEPATVFFFKGVDPYALGIGAAMSAVLSFVMSFIALRRVPRFDLTDINRF